MVISLSDVILDEGKAIHRTLPFERKEIVSGAREGNGLKSHFAVLHSAPIDLTVTNTGGRILEVGGSCSVTVEIPCDRCLRETPCEIPVTFSHRINMDSPKPLPDAARRNIRPEYDGMIPDGMEEIEENGECPYLSDTDLDTDELVCLEVLSNWPFKVLCSQDCLGLCPNCGKDLNAGPCGCKEEPSDLRMAVIGELFGS